MGLFVTQVISSKLDPLSRVQIAKPCNEGFTPRTPTISVFTPESENVVLYHFIRVCKKKQ